MSATKFSICLHHGIKSLLLDLQPLFSQSLQGHLLQLASATLLQTWTTRKRSYERSFSWKFEDPTCSKDNTLAKNVERTMYESHPLINRFFPFTSLKTLHVSSIYNLKLVRSLQLELVLAFSR